MNKCQWICGSWALTPDPLRSGETHYKKTQLIDCYYSHVLLVWEFHSLSHKLDLSPKFTTGLFCDHLYIQVQIPFEPTWSDTGITPYAYT